VFAPRLGERLAAHLFLKSKISVTHDQRRALMASASQRVG
jgi:hypothetical protein